MTWASTTVLIVLGKTKMMSDLWMEFPSERAKGQVIRKESEEFYSQSHKRLSLREDFVNSVICPRPRENTWQIWSDYPQHKWKSGFKIIATRQSVRIMKNNHRMLISRQGYRRRARSNVFMFQYWWEMENQFRVHSVITICQASTLPAQAAFKLRSGGKGIKLVKSNKIN